MIIFFYLFFCGSLFAPFTYVYVLPGGDGRENEETGDDGRRFPVSLSLSGRRVFAVAGWFLLRGKKIGHGFAVPRETSMPEREDAGTNGGRVNG